jgi:hypothetical protein
MINLTEKEWLNHFKKKSEYLHGQLIRAEQKNDVLRGAIQTALKLIWVDTDGREVLERALEEIED